ncbi:flagellar motor protein MotB [Granulicella tundricola]|uniref:OmpA/MotB domain protein n=1 Tax=Granulicella tundricola (strain ATCC BAA-1859 / DSM 23138 / MP5ACTX9) TaxID=1198114 RepID=E8X652_GRATM|nr:flagellar motor protein MotB [Granulicella tundricola]ADW70936.1 OmpA/MotB domain protein [Granulicella tundricola MP5ACTX9]
MADELQPIIVIKKKGAHGGHHGGAWKVAYADFVTAMMSLFIVLWLMSSTSKQTQEEIAGYFNDPKGTSTKHGTEGKESKKEEKESKKDDLAALKKDLMRAIEKIDSLNRLKKQIEMTVTEEGLRIELVEDAKGTFFETGSSKPTPALEEILKVLSEQLKSLPNSISIEGHTDAQPYATATVYGNWELSTDRANVARREMQENGIRTDQVSQVRGFADQRLHVPEKPLDASNRRISLVVQNFALRKPDSKGLTKTDLTKTNVAEAKPEAAPEAKPDQPKAEEAKPTAMALPPVAAKSPVGLLGRMKGIFK